MSITSKKYFEEIRKATARADQLQEVANEFASAAGAGKALSLDAAGISHGKGGAARIDGIFSIVSQCEAYEVRALDAKADALALVAEGAAVLERMLESPDADVPAIAVMQMYYINGLTDDDIAANKVVSTRKVSRSGITKLRQRGLAKAQPYVSALGV